MGSGWGSARLRGQGKSERRSESRSSLSSSLSEYISGLLVTIPQGIPAASNFRRQESPGKELPRIRQLFEIQIQQTLIQSGKAVVMFSMPNPSLTRARAPSETVC